MAGTAGGRRLEAPPGTDTRPTTDRVREAVFNSLWSLGVVDDARVADLFAGSGALGIEALSRGALHVDFVEQDRRSAEVIRRNLDALGMSGRATVHVGTVEAHLGGLTGPFDLVLADPPYAYEGWPSLLDALGPLLARDSVVVVESDRVPPLPAGWPVVREKAYGGTVVTFVQPGGRDTTGAHE